MEVKLKQTKQDIENDYIKGQNLRHFEVSSYGRGSEIDPEVIEANSRKKAASITVVLLIAAMGIPLLFMKPSIQGFTIVDAQAISSESLFIGLIVASVVISVVVIEILTKGLWKQAPEENIGANERVLRKAEDLVKDGRYKRALSVYDRFLLKEPGNKNVLLNKGSVHDELDDPKSAIKAYDKILKTNPKNTKALYNKGMSFLQLDELSLAFQCFSKVLEINKNDIPALRKISFILFSREQFNEVIKLCNKALKFDEKNIDMMIIKGLSLGRLGKKDSALKCFDKALKIDPLDAWAFKCKSELSKTK